MGKEKGIHHCWRIKMKEYIINFKNLCQLDSDSFFEFLNYCEERKNENKFFADLYDTLNAYGYDFAAPYIGDDV